MGHLRSRSRIDHRLSRMAEKGNITISHYRATLFKPYFEVIFEAYNSRGLLTVQDIRLEIALDKLYEMLKDEKPI